MPRELLYPSSPTTGSMKKAPKTPITCALVAAFMMSSGQAAIIGFSEDFTSTTLDPEWAEGGDTGTFDATNDLYSLTHSNGDDSPKLTRFEGGTNGDFTHTITIDLVSFEDTGADFKWKSFGSDGFTEVVLNSFGNARFFHTGGDLVSGVAIGANDGDTVSFTQSYTVGDNLMSITYSINGGADQTLYSGAGNGAGYGDVVTNFAQVEVFEFGAGDPVPVVNIDAWSLTAGVVPEPSTSVLLAAFLGLAASRRRRC